MLEDQPDDALNRMLYRIEYLGDLSLGDFKYAEILGFWEGVLKTTERVARAPDVSEDERKAILAQHPLLGRPSDLKLWQAFAQDMPGVARFFNRFLLVEGLATPRHHPVVGDYLAVDLQSQIRLSTFQREFPALAERFKFLQFVLRVTGSHFLMPGREQAEMGRIFREAYDSLNADYRDVRKRVGVLN